MRRPLPSSPLFPYTTLFRSGHEPRPVDAERRDLHREQRAERVAARREEEVHGVQELAPREQERQRPDGGDAVAGQDRKSTRLNSSHVKISYAVFCLNKKKET